MKIVCERRYGRPKLVKPKCCSNKTLIGSVRWSDGDRGSHPVQCKVWLSDGQIYVLHRDWFSEAISFEEAKRRGMEVKIRNKFIYNDNFAGVILRSEAVIAFDLPDLSESILRARQNLVEQFAAMFGKEWYDLYLLHRWEDFFEAVIKLIRERVDKI